MNTLPRPRIHKTDADKSRAYQARRRAEIERLKEIANAMEVVAPMLVNGVWRSPETEEEKAAVALLKKSIGDRYNDEPQELAA